MRATPTPPCLKLLVLRADRSRLGTSLLILVAVHVPLAALAGALSLSGLLALVSIVVIHRVLWVRLVPKLPSAGSLGLAAYVRSQWLRRAAGGVACCVLSVLASLAMHGALLPACVVAASDDAEVEADAPARLPPHLPIVAAWAALVGIASGVQYVRTPSLLDVRWPLLQRDRRQCLMSSVPSFVTMSQAAIVLHLKG